MYRPEQRNGETEPCWGGAEPLSEKIQAPVVASADTVIIGAGVAGLSIAYELLGKGHSVIVLDKGAVGVGETSRSTAHLSDALDDHYVLLERAHGHKGARLAAESHRAGIESIATIVESESIDCGFEWVEGYLFEDEPTGFLERERLAAHRAGVMADLSTGPFPGGSGAMLRFENQAQVDPLAYLRGLAKAVERRGGQIYPLCLVENVQEERSLVSVRLEGGLTLKARHVVVASNAPIHNNMLIHTKQAAYRSYVLGFSNAPADLARALYWDTGDPYHYLRWVGSDTLLVGGEDHRVGKEEHPEQRWSALEQWVRARFPNIGPVNARWSGQVLEPMDGMAFIGRDPGSERTYMVTGDSGNGMTHGALSARLISDLISGTPNAWASLYDPGRIPKRLPSLKEYLTDQAKVAVAYGDWLKPSHSPDEPIAPGHGEVVQRGVHKVAVFDDEAGGRHECSAVCPHLGGVVHWNAAENSWDCPCHGSRFDPYGQVLAGPASRGLSPKNAP
jgi:glycine/D-amino acid oxidase-like deaminating enzyme/nitrite reductase/ring-hydroxylating ferredoxin subunit